MSNMTQTRVWLVELPGGDTAAIRCTEEQADQGEADSLWTVVGSSRLITISQARQEARNGE